MPTGPQIEFARKSGVAAMMKRAAGLTKLAAYVGVPAASASERTSMLLGMAAKTNSKKKKAYLQKSALGDVTNAELLFIHTHGSPINKIPPRPVLQPAINAAGNKQKITAEINGSIKLSLIGDSEGAKKKMLRAALQGQNVCRAWFTDGRNGWAPNKPATIAAKGSDRPLIDTGALRASIVGIVREE
jgi:hypothetical protein